MALTLRRWLLLAVGACAVLWCGLLFRPELPDKGPSIWDMWDVAGQWNYRSTPERAMAGRVALMNARLRLLELRDSVTRSLPTSASAFVVRTDGQLRDSTRIPLEERLNAAWSALGPMNRIPVAVAVVIDTARHPRGLPRLVSYSGGIPIELFLPSAETGGRCLSLVRLAVPVDQAGSEFARQVRSNLLSPESIQSMLGPCALFAAFGEPGPEVRRWMFENDWAPARLAAWNIAATPWSDAIHAGQYRSVAEAIQLQTDPTWEIRRFVGTDGIACLAGRSGACAQALLSPTSAGRDSAWRAKVITSAGTNRGAFYLPQGPARLGPSSFGIMSEMVRTLGRDRFERFWTSTSPVPDAFSRASGTDVDTWMRQWAERVYGPATVGPYLPSVGLFAGLVLLALTIAAAVRIGMRRQVA